MKHKLSFALSLAFCALFLATSDLNLSVVAAESPSSRTSAGNRYALRGTLVTPAEIIPDGTVFVIGDKIEAIGKDIQVPADVKIIKTNAFIYPGLIDLHDHMTWNFLPCWKAGEKFSNRYEWQTRDAYLSALKTPHDRIVSASPTPRPTPQEDLACEVNEFGEVKALVGGATSMIDSLGRDECVQGLVRNLDSYSGLYPPGTLRNRVFPLEIPDEDPDPKVEDIHKINAELNDGHHVLIVHLAEGKRNDASSAREFRMFKARGFLRNGVSIIHGVSLSAADFKEMGGHQVGLIWSPRSNIDLYGETTDVRAAKANGVKIALGPDWSPTGSDGVLEELKYAAAWNAAQNPPVFTDAELVAMVTSVPAELAKAGDKIGSLAQHYFADLLIIHSEQTDPYRAVLTADSRDVRLVIIGGEPIYGDEDLMHSLQPEAQIEPVQLCEMTKFLNLQGDTGPQARTPKSWKETVAALTRELQTSGLNLSELAPCAKDSCCP